VALVAAFGGTAGARTAKATAPHAVAPHAVAPRQGSPATSTATTRTHVSRSVARSQLQATRSMARSDQALALSHISATYTVTQFTDPNPPSGTCPSSNTCNLRAAITKANSHGGVEVIKVPSGHTIDLTPANGALLPTTSMFIQGAGSSVDAITGNAGGTQIFYVDGSSAPYPSVEIDGFTLRNGGTATDGGAVEVVDAGVTLDHDVLRDNAATADGGAIYTSSDSSSLWLTNSAVRHNTAGAGGGIYTNNGQIVITNSTIGGTSAAQGNTASGDAGGFFQEDGEAALYSSHIDFNTAHGTHGGGAYFDNPTVMQGGSISHNTLSHSGAGVEGGGLYINYPTQLVGVSVTHNSASNDSTYTSEGGGIYSNDNLILDGSHVDANELRSTTSNTTATLFGGGIYVGYPTQITGGTVNGNRILNTGSSTFLSGQGGGIYNNDELSILGASVSSNKILGFTSGCSSPCSNGYEEGGGILNADQMKVDNAAINHNRVLGANSAYGGGIADYPSYASQLDHLTLTGNKAESNYYAEGAGIDSNNNVNLSNSNITNSVNLVHVAGSNGAEASAIYTGGAVNLTNVKIAGSTNNVPGYIYYGAIYGGDGVNFLNVTITGTKNTVTGSGGYIEDGAVVYEDGGSAWNGVVISSTTNKAGHLGGTSSYIDGGILYMGDYLKMRNTRINTTSNTVLGTDGDVYGGVIYGSNVLDMSNTSLTATVNSLAGAGSYVYGGAIYSSSDAALLKVAIMGTSSTVGPDDGLTSSYIYGGAYYTSSQSTMDQSTVAHTSAVAKGATSYIYGGGVYIASNLEFSNSTFAGNSAKAPNATGAGNGAYGGAVYLDDNTTFTNVTMSGNKATHGSAVYSDGYQAWFKNTVAFAQSCAKNGGGFTSTGHNDGPSSCGLNGGGDFNKNPLLGPLGQHGGYAPTEVPAKTSPLVNHGTGAGAPNVDERGVNRPQLGGFDIGAVERRNSD
jgi:hypothetical protein